MPHPDSYPFFRKTHTDPIKVRDSITGQNVRVKIYQNSSATDNPMASEVSGHIGGKGNHYCRKCHAGGCGLDKETDNGYHSLFTV
jgi:hypothetical protein